MKVTRTDHAREIDPGVLRRDTYKLQVGDARYLVSRWAAAYGVVRITVLDVRTLKFRHQLAWEADR